MCRVQRRLLRSERSSRVDEATDALRLCSASGVRPSLLCGNGKLEHYCKNVFDNRLLIALLLWRVCGV